MDIIGRLFNHCPAISGEVNMLIQGFDNRLKIDEEAMQLIYNCASNLSDCVLPASQKLVSESLAQIQAKLMVCSEMCDRVAATEEKLFTQVNDDDDDDSELDKLAEDLQLQRDSIMNNFELAREKLIKEYEEKDQRLSSDMANSQYPT